MKLVFITYLPSKNLSSFISSTVSLKTYHSHLNYLAMVSTTVDGSTESCYTQLALAPCSTWEALSHNTSIAVVALVLVLVTVDSWFWFWSLLTLFGNFIYSLVLVFGPLLSIVASTCCRRRN